MSAPRRELVLASENPGKLAELRHVLGAEARALGLCLRSLAELPGAALPPEGAEYASNAIAKARAAARATGRLAIGDDSGLEVDALGGAPGPLSARYGGPGLDDAARSARLLAALAGVPDDRRGARFVCVAALATPEGDARAVRGECAGRIVHVPRGAGGFGYDPIFQPDGERATMAELPAAVKQRLSHRGRALAALVPLLRACIAGDCARDGEP